jgi:hypothetical protein|tara:strand:+ start:299 stop:430 length:132 start_codon:yes stop_codon:yes gene_type:complete
MKNEGKKIDLLDSITSLVQEINSIDYVEEQPLEEEGEPLEDKL